jgi:hypothetical protein
MRRKLLLITGAVLWFIFVASLFLLGRAFPKYGVGWHQRSVTRELAEWERMFGKVSSQQEAVHAAEMMDYAQRYYVPAAGYRSTPEIEAALSQQRQKTIDAIVEALRQFTGKNFAADSDRWLFYLRSNKIDAQPIH